MTERSIFLAALDIADAAGRAAYLDQACAADADLRRRVEALLAAHAASGTFMAHPAAEDDPRDATGEFTQAGPVPFESDQILAGRYHLLGPIGEGGMGTVYRAEQVQPVKRTVAVKVIKAGMDSKAVLARFEAERQALAMMDHPHIARVLDAGTTESGRPYFVMELVKGVPITQFCDERKLTPRQRLELFVQVCQAIQHVHQKGVIHRDIKPSNVLVALYDDRPAPKVIDFGIAKAAGSTLTDKTLMTGFGAVVGTPEYMSPEQAILNKLDIDTRSDVYSLGVLLYELLTGTTPVDKKSHGQAAVLEVLRIVHEVEAPKPSTKLSSSDTLPSVAANRGTEPAKLSKLMKGELDWVLLKALEKDRTRRYESANGLARDVQRYLADEIVEARPPSAGYRLRKIVRRHKGQVIAASLLLFAMLAGIAGTTVALIEAKKQEREADTARRAEADRAEGERLAKEEVLRQKEALERAMIETKAAEGLILLGLRESLRDLPRQRFQETPARPVSAERIVDGMAKSLDQTITHIYDDKLLIQARIHVIMAGIFDDFDLLEPARQQYEMALRCSPGGSKGVLDEATVRLLYGLSGVLFRQAKYQDAVPMLRLVAEWHRNAEGGGSFLTRAVSNRLAESLAGVGQTGEAMRVLKRALEAGRLAHGEDDDTTLESMAILGRIHSSVGEWDEAESQLQRALEIRRRINTPEYPPRLRTAEQLGLHYLRRDKPATAAGLFRECLAVREKNDPDDWTTFHSRSLLGEALLGQKKYAEAEPLLLKGYEGLKAREKTIPPQASTRIPEALDRLVELYTATKKPDEAKKYHELRAKYPPELAPPPREKK